nr:heavy metal translocating P-type ATPase [Rhodococcus kyotonensis]
MRGTRTRVLDVSEVRWALASTTLFVLGLVTQLSPAPSVIVWTLYLACYVCGGWEPALAGVRALREKSLDVDLLMIVAAIGAAAIGQIFDGALLIVIFATSGALEAVLTRRTADSVRSLFDLAPDTAVITDADGTEREVRASTLRPGDVVLVRPGMRIAGEGTVVDGGSDVDQSSITGESIPVYKGVGDDVFAGTVNGTGSLRVRIDVDPSDTVIARIVTMVEHASATKATKQLFIDRVEQYYSTTVVVATLAIFAVPMVLGSEFQPALLRAMTFMIVASPCAVVLATMPPLLSAMATAGRHGVLVKSAVVMEQVRKTTLVAFDKTGTLTEGTPRVESVDILAGSAFDENDVLRLAAAVENASEHPIAAAVVNFGRDRGLSLPGVVAFESTPGAGVSGVVDGHLVTVAKPTSIDDGFDSVHRAQAAGLTAVVVRIDGVPTAVIGLADTMRPDAAAAVAELRTLTGSPAILLTGDNRRAAEAVARRTGIDDVRAELLPGGKADAVRDAQTASRARVLVVGDGVNDAPALAAADIGVAMGRGGSDLALDTSDVVLVRDDLSALPSLIDLSRRAHRIVVTNLVVAASFIVALVTWDLVGTLPLPVGVAGHESSTVLVALNGMRLLSGRAWRKGRHSAD